MQVSWTLFGCGVALATWLVACSSGPDGIWVGRGGDSGSAGSRNDGGGGVGDAATDGAFTGISPGMDGGEGAGADPDCGQLPVTYHGFAKADDHPDFHCNKSGSGITKDLVLTTLDATRKPRYNPNPPAQTGGSNPMIESAESFFDWFHDTPANVISPGSIPLMETASGSGVWRYSSTDHTIVPGEGGFTTEIHAKFVYKPGQEFRFLGDDDVWVFIDGTLVVDIGGLHQDETGVVRLDDLGLTPGATYTLDMFHAERCYPVSHFTLETSIDCFQPVDLI